MTEQQLQTVVARVNILIPETATQSELTTQLANDAADFVLAYTHRTQIPDELLRTVGDLTIIAYNRRGTEGESGRSEGGETYSFETAPAQVYDVLKQYRLARVGGEYYAAEADES